jgi:hypothetical protein
MRLPARTQQIYHVRRSVLKPNALVGTGVAGIFNAISFALSDIDDYTSLIAVFDQYKFMGVEVRLRPTFGTSPTGGGNSTGSGTLVTVIDYDDASALTTPGQALNYANAIQTEGWQGARRCFRPRIAMAAYDGTVFTGYANMGDVWLDAASPDIPHYGVKSYWSTVAANLTMDLQVTYWLAFRASR